MRSIYVIALCVAIGMVWGCKKKNTTSINRLKTESSGYNYFYDKYGRIIKKSSGSDVKIYTYYTDSIIVSDTDLTKIIDKYYLNSQGLVDSSFEFYPPPSSRHKYYYNSENYLVKDAYYDKYNAIYRIDSHIIVNGNEVAYLIKSPGTAKYDTAWVFTYDTSLINTIGNDYKGMNFYGKSSKNVLVKMESSPANISSTSWYRYEYDKQNRIELKVTTYLKGNPNGATFTYY